MKMMLFMFVVMMLSIALSVYTSYMRMRDSLDFMQHRIEIEKNRQEVIRAQIRKVSCSIDNELNNEAVTNYTAFELLNMIKED